MVNTNVLFSFFGKSTTTRELIFLLSGRLVSPEFAVEELYKYKEVIMRKAKITPEEFEFFVSNLREHVMFVREDFYAEFIPIALEITPDKDDADFIALSLKVNAPLWSNDKRLKSVREVQVLTTGKLLKILGVD